MINWIKSRIGERTSWDGGVMIAMGLVALFATGFIKIAAVVAIVYGIWTIWKAEQYVGYLDSTIIFKHSTTYFTIGNGIFRMG